MLRHQSISKQSDTSIHVTYVRRPPKAMGHMRAGSVTAVFRYLQVSQGFKELWFGVMIEGDN